MQGGDVVLVTMTLGDAICNALLTPDDSLEPKEKLKRTKLAERIAAEQYDGYRQAGADPHDLVKDSGAVAEVKSTATTLANGNAGRFRLWEEQHEELLRADREGSARYVFVLFDVSSRPVSARLKTRVPASVGRQIGARGGWNRSGHSAGPQHKLPIDAVF